MNIVNFSITEPLAKKINRVIKEWGFTSKAEFFRFIALNFIERHEESRMRQLSENIRKIAKRKLGNKKLPSIEDQLADLL